MICAPTAKYSAKVHKLFADRGSNLSILAQNARSKGKLIEPLNPVGTVDLNHVLELWFNHEVVHNAVSVFRYENPKQTLYNWAMLYARDSVTFFLVSMLYATIDIVRNLAPLDVLIGTHLTLELSK